MDKATKMPGRGGNQTLREVALAAIAETEFVPASGRTGCAAWWSPSPTG